jgi:glycine cleavage system H lipoate-binding protein
VEAHCGRIFSNSIKLQNDSSIRTKGAIIMTVIFVVMTIITFLTLDAIVRRERGKKAVPAATLYKPVPAYPVRLPEGIFFARSHTWMSLFPSGKVRLGVDDFVGRLLDKPQVEYLKREGEAVTKGEPLFALTEGGRTLTVRAPMDGRIVGVNQELPKRPELLKENLFSDGWAFTIQPNKPSELRQMLLGEETRRWIPDEFRKLRDVFAAVPADDNLVPALLQDGGPPVAGALKQMGDDVWQSFEDEFLTVR